MVLVTPLYTPTDLTQKAPNKGKLSKMLTARRSPNARRSKALPKAAPRKTPAQAPLPAAAPQIAKDAPKVVITEPPKIQAETQNPQQSSQIGNSMCLRRPRNSQKLCWKTLRRRPGKLTNRGPNLRESRCPVRRSMPRSGISPEMACKALSLWAMLGPMRDSERLKSSAFRRESSFEHGAQERSDGRRFQALYACRFLPPFGGTGSRYIRKRRGWVSGARSLLSLRSPKRGLSRK